MSPAKRRKYDLSQLRLSRARDVLSLSRNLVLPRARRAECIARCRVADFVNFDCEQGLNPEKVTRPPLQAVTWHSDTFV